MTIREHGRHFVSVSIKSGGHNSPVKRLFDAGIVAAIGLTMIIGALPMHAAPADEASTAAQTKVMLSSLQNAFSNIAEELEPTVVTVSISKVLRNDKDPDAPDAPPHNSFPPGHGARIVKGTGSGVIIRKDGWILTNDHVVSGAERVTVKMHDGREFIGTVRRDYRSDLALIKVESPTPLPTARLGDSDTAKIGHWAIAIGSPYRYEGSFSVGVISSLFRQHKIRDAETHGAERLYPNMIQTDAAINPGNSGGPLVNLDGQVIGINTAIESEGGGSIGIGFAIPINTAKFVVDQLMAKGKVSYGYLGIAPRDVTPRQAMAFGVNEGAWVDEEPRDDSPARKAGLHAGDVITSINGKTIHNELDLRTIIAQTQPDTSVDITYLRDHMTKTVKAMLVEAISPETENPKPKDPSKALIGMEVQPITDRLAALAGLPANVTGVVIKSIDANGAAADLDGLTEGSVILKVNDTNTPTMAAYRTAIEHLKPGDQVRLVFQNRDGKYFKVLALD